MRPSSGGRERSGPDAPGFGLFFLQRSQQRVLVDLVWDRVEQADPEKALVGAIRVDPVSEPIAEFDRNAPWLVTLRPQRGSHVASTNAGAFMKLVTSGIPAATSETYRLAGEILQQCLLVTIRLCHPLLEHSPISRETLFSSCAACNRPNAGHPPRG